MAVIYLSSVDGSDSDTGLTWALAKATLVAAATAAGAGGIVYIDNAHAETQASAMTITSPGTAASPTRYICVSRAGNPEPPTALSTTATVSTTGANTIRVDGCGYFYGIAFKAGSSSNAANILTAFAQSVPHALWFDTCILNLNNTGGALIGFGQAANGESMLVRLTNTVLNFGSTSQLARCYSGNFIWEKTASAITGSAPTVFMDVGLSNSNGPAINIRGVDLATITGTLFNVGVNIVGRVVVENCKLGSGVAITTGTHPGQGGPEIIVSNCDSADTNYRFAKVTYQGTITQETTIKRTGGSSDGTTGFCRKLVSTANSKIYSPLETLPVTFWNETVGSVTVEAEVVTDNVTLTDAEAWIEVEYLGTSGFPLSLAASDRVADLVFGTPANQTTSTVTWTTTGLSTPVKQTLSVTFTTTGKGPIRARVMLAKASTTIYVDQLRLSTSGRQYMIGAEGIMNEGAGGGLLNPSGMTGGNQQT